MSTRASSHRFSTTDLAAVVRAVGGRATSARVAVLSVLLGTHHPLSHRDVEDELLAHGHSIDRVTLYRTLEWLEAVGLAHKIAGDDRIWRFRGTEEAGHEHAHFQCRACGTTLCLDKVPQPAVPVGMPRGYRVESASLTVRGLCPGCRD